MNPRLVTIQEKREIRKENRIEKRGQYSLLTINSKPGGSKRPEKPSAVLKQQKIGGEGVKKGFQGGRLELMTPSHSFAGAIGATAQSGRVTGRGVSEGEKGQGW